ncbi:aspartyl-phosphate phosphatase Spo0E family protein [Ammoniphilus sp. CFH 90114]|uniref:aspartyl-phosphate phosphatase Spo0E family protein n=1 Tax=Ammoniphilus sp. CFH 90114 TaxID=2493665 RepID=UPI00100E238B|nr:aspartyl-phosphate phosphatase Spo0E family protein [Ammoniphilus sp. CFH 90114]RXT05280.1 aspartyl-phosphate phosphatase Spo0E family protein [Ammoniphilus sp. CFH 90114]
MLSNILLQILIEKKREYLHELAKKKGLSNPEVLQVSQELDGLIYNYQRILAVMAREIS